MGSSRLGSERRADDASRSPTSKNSSPSFRRSEEMNDTLSREESALTRLFAECGWKCLAEISPDQFLKMAPAAFGGCKDAE